MINLAVGEDLLITLVKLIYDRMSNKFREIFDQLDWHFEAWGVSINKNSKNAIEKTDLRIVLGSLEGVHTCGIDTLPETGYRCL